MLLSVLLVACNLAILGGWTAARLEGAIRSEVGLRAAGMLEGILAPHERELAAGVLTAEATAAIEREFNRIAPRLGIVELKVWGTEGQIIFGSRPGLSGQSFPVDGLLARALAGTLAVEVQKAVHLDHPRSEPARDESLFEIYAPIRADSDDRVIAVGEFYQTADQTAEAIARARWMTWGMVVALSGALIAGLNVVVAEGDQIITRQQSDLNARVVQLTALLEQNEKLQERIQSASHRSNEDFENHLRRIGADLHDGIGQLLTVALLRLDEAVPGDAAQGTARHTIRAILEEAMAELRALTKGLSLPKVSGLRLAGAIEAVVRSHEGLTGTRAELRIAGDLVEPDHAMKLGICRFVQEGLNNAFKHAEGKGQTVQVSCADNWVTVVVRDSGPGMSAPVQAGIRQPLGLSGLKNRVESLGGTFRISSVAGQGTEILARFPVEAKGQS